MPYQTLERKEGCQTLSWERVLRYTHRVKRLGYPLCDYEPVVPQELLQDLIVWNNSRAPPHFLFPNILTIDARFGHFMHYRPDIASFIRSSTWPLLLGPKVKDVKLFLPEDGNGNHDSKPITQAHLKALSSSCHNISDLYLNVRGRDDGDSAADDFFRDYQGRSLTHLAWAGPMSKSLVRTLSSYAGLCSLRCLSFSPRSEEDRSLPRLPFNEGFRDLRCLSISTAWETSVASLFDIHAALGTHLETLSLTTLLTNPPEIFQCIGGGFPQLTSLQITHQSVDHWEGSDGPYATIKAIRSLFALQKLTVFTLNLNGAGLTMVDEDLIEMTKAWPQLQKLHLAHSSQSTGFTHSGIMAAVQNCPNLESLGITWDTTSLPTVAPTGLTRGVRAQKLTKFNVYIWSPIDPDVGPVAAAAFLTELAPNLELVDVTGPVPVPEEFYDESPWREVQNMLGVLRSVRAQGRHGI